MKYLKDDIGKNDADCATDAVTSTAVLEQHISAIDERINELPAGSEVLKAGLEVEKAALMIDLEEMERAWAVARTAFDVLLEAREWELAAQACLVMFQTEQPQSMAALGHAIWLTVTFPMDPELSVAIMQQVVDETPDDSDGGAIAAVVAHFLVDLRCDDDKQRESLLFFTNNLIGHVARRHSDVSTQEKFDAWFARMELDNPDKFLVRLRNIVDVMVQEDWWLDRESLQANLPN